VKGVGVDCMQYLIAVYSAVGIIPAIETDYYAADWFIHGREERILDVIGEYMIAVTDPQPGDVALFRFGRMVAHGAIVTHWPMILHAYRGRPVAFDSADIDGTMATRFASAWTPKRWVTP
jgi:cell wall-associated NlpC family hydrolase